MFNLQTEPKFITQVVKIQYQTQPGILAQWRDVHGDRSSPWLGWYIWDEKHLRCAVTVTYEEYQSGILELSDQQIITASEQLIEVSMCFDIFFQVCQTHQWGTLSRMHIIIEHYDDVIMVEMASQITSITIVYSTVYTGADQRTTSKLCVTGLCAGIHRLASDAENVSIWWRHH